MTTIPPSDTSANNIDWIRLAPPRDAQSADTPVNIDDAFCNRDWLRFVAHARKTPDANKLYPLIVVKYSPDEARVPSGSPGGGEWTSDGDTSGNGHADGNVLPPLMDAHERWNAIGNLAESRFDGGSFGGSGSGNDMSRRWVSYTGDERLSVSGGPNGDLIITNERIAQQKDSDGRYPVVIYRSQATVAEFDQATHYLRNPNENQQRSERRAALAFIKESHGTFAGKSDEPTFPPAAGPDTRNLDESRFFATTQGGASENASGTGKEMARTWVTGFGDERLSITPTAMGTLNIVHEAIAQTRNADNKFVVTVRSAVVDPDRLTSAMESVKAGDEPAQHTEARAALYLLKESTPARSATYSQYEPTFPAQTRGRDASADVAPARTPTDELATKTTARYAAYTPAHVLTDGRITGEMQTNGGHGINASWFGTMTNAATTPIFAKRYTDPGEQASSTAACIVNSAMGTIVDTPDVAVRNLGTLEVQPVIDNAQVVRLAGVPLVGPGSGEGYQQRFRERADALGVSDQARALGLYDVVIGNQDRHTNNWMLTSDDAGKNHVIAIDQSLAFPDRGSNVLSFGPMSSYMGQTLTDDEVGRLAQLSLHKDEVNAQFDSAGLHHDRSDRMWRRVDFMLANRRFPKPGDDFGYGDDY